MKPYSNYILSLFSDLDKNIAKEFLSVCQEKKFNAGEYLIREGEKAEEFFIIIEGSVEVSKFDPIHNVNNVISTLPAGEILGEMAWLQEKTRTASVRAALPVVALSIKFSDVEQLVKEKENFFTLFLHLTKNLSRRLNDSNNKIIRAMAHQLQEYKMRILLGTFTVYAIVAANVSSILIYTAPLLKQLANSTTFITLPITALFFILLASFLGKTKMSLKIVGLTTDGWRKALYEGIVFTLPVLLLAVLFKLFLIHFVPGFMGRPLWEPYHDLNFQAASESSPLKLWAISVVLYVLISSPLQELLVRGTFQGPLQFFLTGKHKNLVAILVTNICFATMHLLLSWRYALIVFVPGLYFGWLYSRHQTLIGVCVAHILLGFWGTWVIGF